LTSRIAKLENENAKLNAKVISLKNSKKLLKHEIELFKGNLFTLMTFYV